MCHLSKGPGGGLGKRAPQSLREFIPTLPSSPLPHLYSFSPPLLFTLLLIFSPFCTPPPLFFFYSQCLVPEKRFLQCLLSSQLLCVQLCVCVCRVAPLGSAHSRRFKRIRSGDCKFSLSFYLAPYMIHPHFQARLSFIFVPFSLTFRSLIHKTALSHSCC